MVLCIFIGSVTTHSRGLGNYSESRSSNGVFVIYFGSVAAHSRGLGNFSVSRSIL